MAKLNLVEMTVSGPIVRLLYADGATKEQSTEWMELALNIEGDDNRLLGVIQKAALGRLQTLIADEMTRFQSLADRLRQERL